MSTLKERLKKIHDIIDAINGQQFVIAIDEFQSPNYCKTNNLIT